MIYDSLARNRRILDNLFGRKVFKKHCFINDNEEGYEWDNYDISYFYKDKKDYRYHRSYKTITTQTQPQTKNSSTQATPQTKDSSTQATPQTRDSSTQASKHFTNVSTQTEPIENKIHLYESFLLFIKTVISNRYY